jgi:hypothetical protein
MLKQILSAPLKEASPSLLSEFLAQLRVTCCRLLVEEAANVLIRGISFDTFRMHVCYEGDQLCVCLLLSAHRIRRLGVRSDVTLQRLLPAAPPVQRHSAIGAGAGVGTTRTGCDAQRHARGNAAPVTQGS